MKKLLDMTKEELEKEAKEFNLQVKVFLALALFPIATMVFIFGISAIYARPFPNFELTFLLATTATILAFAGFYQSFLTEVKGEIRIRELSERIK